MPSYNKKYRTVDRYIANYPAAVAKRLQQIRKLIKASVPAKTKEVISYNIPGYQKPTGGRPYIYFAGFDKHVSLYPLRPERTNFAKELKPYHSGTATLKFPHDQPLPKDLIEKVIKHLVTENA